MVVISYSYFFIDYHHFHFGFIRHLLIITIVVMLLYFDINFEVVVINHLIMLVNHYVIRLNFDFVVI